MFVASSMRYRLSTGIEIRTENAAKPVIAAVEILIDLVANLPHVASAFDYGYRGKLRYQRADCAATADLRPALSIWRSELSSERKACGGEQDVKFATSTKGSNNVHVSQRWNFRRQARASSAWLLYQCVVQVIPSYPRRQKGARGCWHEKLHVLGAECLFVTTIPQLRFCHGCELCRTRCRWSRWASLSTLLRGDSFCADDRAGSFGGAPRPALHF